MTETAIIITMRNCVEYSKACVESIQTKYPYTLILIDDFSVDGTKAWCEQLYANSDNITVVMDEPTESLSEKWNLGVRLSKQMGCGQALVCNNDILFSSNTIDALIERLELARSRNENVGMVTAHNRRGDLKDPKDIFTLAQPEGAVESDGPDFSCFLLAMETFDKVGEFDTAYIPCYFEDNDYHLRMAQSGIRAICTPAAPYYHYGSITQNSFQGGLCKGPQFEANRDYFIQKFGFRSDSPEYSMIINSVPKFEQ